MYQVTATGAAIPRRPCSGQLGLSEEDLQYLSSRAASTFVLPLTNKSLAELRRAIRTFVVSVTPIITSPDVDLFPQDLNTHWTVDNYGPAVDTCQRSSTIVLNDDNLPFYEALHPRIRRQYARREGRRQHLYQWGEDEPLYFQDGLLLDDGRQPP
jgi:hypothetical protein